MRVQVRRAVPGDIDRIVADLSDVSKGEIEMLSLDGTMLRDSAVHGVLSGEAVAGEIDGVLGCVFWFYPVAGDCYTYFLSAPSYFENPVDYTRATRRTLKSLAKLYPTSRFVSLTASPHPAVAKWFRSIGFLPRGEKNGLKEFEFRSL